MHELAAAQDIVRAVLEAAEKEGASRITSIALRVGRTYAVENLQELVAIAAKGTIAEGAKVEAEAVPGADIQVASINIE